MTLIRAIVLDKCHEFLVNNPILLGIIVSGFLPINKTSLHLPNFRGASCRLNQDKKYVFLKK